MNSGPMLSQLSLSALMVPEKVRIGIWIEEKNENAPVHRISAQRALSVPDLIYPRPYEQAMMELQYGAYQPQWNEEQYRIQKPANRWSNDPVGHLLTDFELLLATLFAQEIKRSREYAHAAHTIESRTI